MSNRFLKSQLLSIPLIAMLSTNIQTAVASDTTAEEIFGAIGKNGANGTDLSEPVDINDLKSLPTDSVQSAKYLYECIKTVISNFYYIGQSYNNDGKNDTFLNSLAYDDIRTSYIQSSDVLKNVKGLQTSDSDTINLEAILDEFTIHMAHSFEQLVSRSPDSYISRFMQVLISLNHKLIDVANDKFKSPTEAKECLSEFIYTAKKAIEELGAVSTLKERPAILMLSLMLNGIGQSKDIATPIDTLPMEVTNDAATQMYADQKIIDGVKLAIKALQTGAEEALSTVTEQELENTPLVSTELSKEMLAKDVYSSIEQDYNIQPQDIIKVKEEIANAVANQNYINNNTTSIINNIYNKISFNNIFQDYITKNDAADLLAAHTEDILEHIKKIASQGTQISYNKYYKVISDQLCGYTNKLRDKDRIVKGLLDLIDTNIANSLIPIDDLKYEAQQEQDEIDRDTEISTNLALTLKTNNIMFNRADLANSNLLNTIYNAGKLQYEDFEQIQGTTIFNDQNIALATLEQKINRYNALTKEQKWLAKYEILNNFMSQECGDDYKNKPYWQQMNEYDKRTYEKEMDQQKKYNDYKNIMAWMIGVTNRTTSTADDENERKKLGKFLSEKFINHSTTKATVQEELGGAREVSEDEQNRAIGILYEIKRIVKEHTESTDEYQKSRPAQRNKLIADNTSFESSMLDAIDSNGLNAFDDLRICGRPVTLYVTPKSRENDESIKKYVETASSILITLPSELVAETDIEDGEIKESAKGKYISDHLYSEEAIESEQAKDLSVSTVLKVVNRTPVAQDQKNKEVFTTLGDQIKTINNVRRNSKGNTPKENVINIQMEGDDNGAGTGGDIIIFGNKPTENDNKPLKIDNGTKPNEAGNPKPGSGTHNPSKTPKIEIELENKIVQTVKLTDFLTEMKKTYKINDDTHDADIVCNILEAMLIKDGNLLKGYDSLDMDVTKLTEKIDSITKAKTIQIGGDIIDLSKLKIANYITDAEDNDPNARPGILFSRSGGKITTKLENIQVITPPHPDDQLHKTVITLIAYDGAHVKNVDEITYKKATGATVTYEEDKKTPKSVNGTIGDYNQILQLGDEKANIKKLIYLIKDKIEYTQMRKEKTNEKGEPIINATTNQPEIGNINVAKLNNVIITDNGGHVITEADVKTAEDEINAELKKKDIKGLEAQILKGIKLINKEVPEAKATEAVTKKLEKITNEQQLREYLREIHNKKTQLTAGDKDALFMAAVKHNIKVNQNDTQLKLEGVTICDLTSYAKYIKTGNLEDGTVKLNANGSLNTSAEIIKDKNNIIEGYKEWLKQLTKVNNTNHQRISGAAEIEAYIKRLKATKYIDDCLDGILAEHEILGLTRVGTNLKASNEIVCAVKDLIDELKNAQHDDRAIVEYDGNYFRYEDVEAQAKHKTISDALKNVTKQGNDDNKYLQDITRISSMLTNAVLNNSYVEMLHKEIYDNMLENNAPLTQQMKQAKAIILGKEKIAQLPPEQVTKIGDPMTKDDHIKKAEASDIQGTKIYEMKYETTKDIFNFIRQLRHDGKILPEETYDPSLVEISLDKNDDTNRTYNLTLKGVTILQMKPNTQQILTNVIKKYMSDLIDSIRTDVRKGTRIAAVKNNKRANFVNAIKLEGQAVYTK